MKSGDKVIIIGAGPSGLTSAKYALENGLQPLVLQKNSEIGGVWNQETGITWRSMRTNLSKYSCSFVGFPWDEKDDMFVPTHLMQDYFLRYAEHFGLKKYIRLNCQVIKLDLADQDNGVKQYYVEWKNEKGEVQKQIVQKLIVANGIFDKPFYPEMPGLNDFKGKVYHSHDYRQGQQFKDKKVLVVGGSFTGIELSADLSRHTKLLYHSFRKPFILLEHFIEIAENKRLPIDLTVIRYINACGKQDYQDIEGRVQGNKVLLKYAQKQQEIPEIRVNEEDLKQPLFLTISTDYIPHIKKNLIIPKRGKISGFKEHSVIFEDGSQQEIDAIMLCTGYITELKFLSERIKQKIEYNAKQQRQPTILFKQMLHPDLQNLIFVGVNKGINIQSCEIQSRFAISVLTGKTKLPEYQQLVKGLEIQRQFRQLASQPQCPHANYVRFAYGLVKIMDPNFDLQKLSQENPQQYKQLLKLPVIQQPRSWSFDDLDQQIKYLNRIIEISTTNIQNKQFSKL